MWHRFQDWVVDLKKPMDTGLKDSEKVLFKTGENVICITKDHFYIINYFLTKDSSNWLS